jgi:secreted trypsin-like serine protease
MRRFLASAFAATAIAASFGTPAQAITGGEPDNAGHPSVGLLVFYAEDGSTNARFRCSGTLVTKTIVLTAGHCTDGTAGKTIVTFETAPNLPLPRAADDTGTGESATGYTSTPAGFYSGTALTHPQYSDFTDLKNWNDVGVIALDQEVTGITPSTIAPANFLSSFAQPVLNKTNFTLVGYGTEVRKPESGPQKPTPQSLPLIRRVTTSNGQKLTDQVVQMNGNPANVLAGGGTCFGDSGGPSYVGGYLTTVTSYGLTANCRYIGGYQRVDIPSVRNWLAAVGALSWN